MRKKTPTNTNTATAAVNLDDDEQLVEEITTTKKIGRQRRPPASEEVITVEPEDDDEDDLEPEFAENSLAAVLFGDSSETNYENEFCTIQVRRNPDSMNDRFLTPCGAVANLAPLRNIELTADKMDIEDRVRSEYGGGHYYFQIWYGGKLGRSWKATLADDPAAVARAKADADAKLNPQPVQSPTPAQPPKDPMDSMIDSITKMKLLKDALFGDEAKRLEKLEEENQRLREEAAKPKETDDSPETRMLKTALGIANPTIQERVLDSIFPADSGGHWIPETLKTVFEHKEEIGGILGGLLGGLAPKPPTPPNIVAMLKQQPPNALPSAENEPAALPTSSFRRRPIAADSPTPADDGDDTDARSELAANVEQPSAEFLASLTIDATEVEDPFANDEQTNDGTNGGDAEEKTDDGK